METFEVYKDKVVKKIIERFNPICIYLFGSFVKGTVRKDSDVDIAFLSEEKTDPYQVFLVAQEIAETVRREVDLVNLSEASTVFKIQVVANGKLLYCTNEQKKDEFEMLVYKMYAKLNEERKPVLDAIRESGRIYE
ncbi:type VII toxin-antitoxin system MntA family adenylyltransferase antitoxin [Bacillus sp. FJAT-45350]|uniref:type VII toxin-antitoxin system MntA family adenylyltransferase antitoxin n=1 Tax=Bacillus sp. FJAT-45350 TaxID=2011014 RepID=UPI000BB75E08|nr:nucleotidyltransferase domain-containing protein [Bacillus sp. FJAT-45350]